MSNHPSTQGLRDQAVERLKDASLAFAHAEAGLASLPLSALETDIIIGLFIVDDAYPTTNPFSAILQAVAAWPNRRIDDWTSLYEAIHRHPAWAEYRLRRDLLAAAQTLEYATAPIG